FPSTPLPPTSSLSPYTTLFRSLAYANAGKLNLGAFAKPVGGGEAGFQMEFLFERIKIAGRIQYQKGQYRESEKDEHPDTQFAERHFVSSARHNLFAVYKTLNVSIAARPQQLVRSAKNYLSVA